MNYHNNYVGSASPINVSSLFGGGINIEFSSMTQLTDGFSIYESSTFTYKLNTVRSRIVVLTVDIVFSLPIYEIAFFDAE